MMPKNVIQLSLFFTPALLLWTPNFSVVVIGMVFIYSLYYCFKNRENIYFDSFDTLVFLIFSIYLIINIPNIIKDAGNFRYTDGPSRIFLCFPIYIMMRNELSKFCVRDYIEWGVIVGSIGALGIAFLQYFLLDYPRVDGFLFSINFGYLSCSLAFLNLSLISGSQKKNLLLVGFLSALFATGLTFTRGAILAIPFLLVLSVLLFRSQVTSKNILVGALAFLLMSVVAYTFSSGVQNRVLYTVNEASHIFSGNVERAQSAGGRLQLWHAAVEAFKANPSIGLTYRERESLNETLFELGEINAWTAGVKRGHAHSQYFEMLASNGSLAFFAFILLLLTPSIILIRSRYNEFSRTGIIFISGISFFGLTEVLLQANLISSYFGFFLAFFLASSKVKNRPELTSKRLEVK